MFVPPAPYPTHISSDTFWYGSEALWTNVPIDGVWHLNNLAQRGTYANKLIFWHRGFDWRKEREPKFTFTARRLDVEAQPLVQSGAIPVFVTGATSAMMIGMSLPSAGCWELTADYHGHLCSVLWCQCSPEISN